MNKFRLLKLIILSIPSTFLAANSVFASNDDYDGGGIHPCCFTSPQGITTVNQNGPYASPVQGKCPTCNARGGNFPNNQPIIKEAPPVKPSSGGRAIGGGGGSPGGGGGKFNNRQ